MMKGGTKTVTLQISDEFYRFAEWAANEWGYFGLADYLAATLKRAILEDMETPLAPPDREPEKLLVEDDGGGKCLADDLDDDIPF
jgi:hypothetical protein